MKKKYGDDLIVWIISTHRKGNAYKLNFTVEASKWGIENNITKFELITHRSGGSILLVPIIDSNLTKELEAAKKKNRIISLWQ
jgi:hypothetical protein